MHLSWELQEVNSANKTKERKEDPWPGRLCCSCLWGVFLGVPVTIPRSSAQSNKKAPEISKILWRSLFDWVTYWCKSKHVWLSTRVATLKSKCVTVQYCALGSNASPTCSSVPAFCNRQGRVFVLLVGGNVTSWHAGAAAQKPPFLVAKKEMMSSPATVNLQLLFLHLQPL